MIKEKLKKLDKMFSDAELESMDIVNYSEHVDEIIALYNRRKQEIADIWNGKSENEHIKSMLQKMLIRCDNPEEDDLIPEIVEDLYQIALQKRSTDNFLHKSFSRFFLEGIE